VAIQIGLATLEVAYLVGMVDVHLHLEALGHLQHNQLDLNQVAVEVESLAD